MSKFSSFKEHQLITESWKKFLSEDEASELERLKDAPLARTQRQPEPVSLAARLWDVLGMVGSIAAGLVVGPGPGRKHGDSMSADDDREFQEHRNPGPLTEGEGPSKAFSDWSKMFPKAGEALMSVLEALMGEEIPGVVKHDRTQAERDQAIKDQRQAAAQRGPHPGPKYEE